MVAEKREPSLRVRDEDDQSLPEGTPEREAPSKPAPADPVPELPGGTYVLTVEVPNIPTAKDVGKVDEGGSDPSLVEIPGLGQFRNGTTNKVAGVNVLATARMFASGNLNDLNMPVGVQLKKVN
jgi:hypothetical protein